MRRIVRCLALGVVVCLGCAASPNTVNEPLPSDGPAGKSSALHVAFDDLSVAHKPSVPIRLTASDGSGLALVEVSARAVVDDPLAFTELRLVFENPEDRVREGTFTIVLPQGASISRFAMKIDGGLQEGEVVERQQARVAYEDFLHRKQDPALLEQSAGNEFSARVFPIPARGRKELVVSFSQEITSATPYVLPLVGLPEIASLEVEAFVAGRAAPVQKLSQRKVVPAADFRLDTKLFDRRGGLRNGNLVAARVKPVVASRPEPLAGALILVDTSASRALGMAEQARIVTRITAAIARSSGEQGRVLVAAYDQAIEPIYEGPAAGFGDDSIRRMRQRMALGASDLEAALSWARARAKAGGHSRIILVTDGIPTVGATGGAGLRGRVLALRESGVERLDAIGVGGIRDDDLLRSLANAGLAKGGTVIDGAVSEQELVRRLSEATASGLEVKVENAQFVFPSKLDGVQAGDEAIVYANVPDDKPIRVSVGGTAWESPDVARVERPLLERAWVGAKIESLLEKERTAGPSEALSKEILSLSTQFRVLSPKSALLVLETDGDYRRFGIDRRALADVLVADGGRVSLLKRSVPAPPKPVIPLPQVVSAKPPAKPKPPAPKATAARPTTRSGAWGGDALGNDPMSARGNMWGEEIGDSFGAGGLGLTGIGEGGGGRSEGIGLGRIGTIGHGAGTGSSPGFGSGDGSSQVVSQRSPAAAVAPPPPPPEAAPRRNRASRAADEAVTPEVTNSPPDGEPDIQRADPYTGQFKVVMELIAAGRLDEAVGTAFAWRKRDPGDVLALVALGEGFEAAGDALQAARCYGSIIDLFPSRADMRRFAGERLERISARWAHELAKDTYEKAEEQRPDHPASYRLYAYSLLRRGEPERAFEAIVRGLGRGYPQGRFAGVERILAEDLGLIGAAWAKAEPSRAADILRRIRDEGGLIEDQPSLRFVLHWETDANDVDFHIRDAKGNHAYYGRPKLRSGGVLYADVTTGYGPECFTIREPPGKRAGPYVLQANYYSRGPMGYGMGKLQVIEHDGKGGLVFEERPFVVMNDRAYVDLGRIER
jgi:hypothetical protein